MCNIRAFGDLILRHMQGQVVSKQHFVLIPNEF